MKLKIVVDKGEDGFWAAHCPSLKGCWSQGRTQREAVENIREAIELYLKPDPKEVVPKSHRKVLALIF